jgi:hypothetical protein
MTVERSYDLMNLVWSRKMGALLSNDDENHVIIVKLDPILN